MILLRTCSAIALAAILSSVSATAATAQDTDPHLALEGVETPSSLAWVKAQNDKTLPILSADPRFAGLQANALTILASKDRIAMPNFIGKTVFNFWQDQTHVRGVWRRTSLESYKSASPQWETVIDLDALAAAEGKNWIWKGADCRPKTHDRCLVNLSNGGKDAVTVREFDLTTKAFVDPSAGGFVLPESKQTIEWLDADTLILTRDWGPGTTTDSGYGFVIKTLKRGQVLDQAVEVYRGQKTDVSARPNVLRDAKGNRVVLIEQATDFFNSLYFEWTPNGLAQLPLPKKGGVVGMLDGALVVKTEEAWTFANITMPAGSLALVSPERLRPGNEIVVSTGCDPCAILSPGPRQSIAQATVTDNRVVAVVYDNVRGSLVSLEDKGDRGGVVKTSLPVTDNAAVTLGSHSDEGDLVFYTDEGFTTPTQLRLADATKSTAETVKSLPAQFNATNLVVEQKSATSKDGTKIPYFLVHRKDWTLNGQNPTLLHAYGGFNLSKLPVYDPLIGKLWLERGGAYAVANIRGGGEFGPAWHEAALKANRQRAYDDYFAVAEKLIADKATSPRHLGAYGRSNGGLLMGVAMTERPDLWNAVVVESPLLDMIRYTVLPAGASWIGEYGDPAISAERAWIEKYSPYQNLKPGVKYPLAYITTSTKDDRVHPGHARKFAARLDDLKVDHLYFENTDGGHANGADPKANARRWALHYTYLSRQLMDH
ncbi:S9 family peptidase [Caulobacter segnis]|uniref:Prolyl oligopeptidase n=2 Tax=Caulobacter segnis TaxID=88688 RepID=D5VQ32_CAUST|nr:prolyl oligopeptidase family protein [Caulobacter segnis]ADG12605.1 Prolyl oligopeptidase [Caulobacter segnis ATCC 21756]AVQ04180.1 S9 family peptidase [Caulobacter segnis]